MRRALIVIAVFALAASGSACAVHSGAVEAAPAAAQVKDEPHAPAPPKLIRTTPAVTNDITRSELASAADLERSIEAGKALQRELNWVRSEHAAASGDVAAGEYLVTYLITPADDYYDLEPGIDTLPVHHTTVAPGSAHVSVVVRDAADGRAVDGLVVSATLRSEVTGETVHAALPFGWHPVLNRYGENVVLPRDPFTLTVDIAAAQFERSDSVNGDRFGENVTARFAAVTVSPDSLADVAQRLAMGSPARAISLARAHGQAIGSTISARVRARPSSGLERRSGDYDVAVAVGPAEGTWVVRDGGLAYRPVITSAGPVNNIAISIRDAASGRTLPDLKVRATIVDSRNRKIDTYNMPFVWSVRMDAYALNVAVPGDGRYTIQVRADAPVFRKYGSSAAKQFKRAVRVDFRGLHFVKQ